MKDKEKGFTLIEALVVTAIVAIIGSAAVATTFQIAKGTENKTNQVAVLSQLQNAGYRIYQDAQMAENVVTENLQVPNLFILSWTEYDYSGGDSIYHTATYFFADLSQGVGKLKRRHWSSAGANEETLIAQNVFYLPTDPDTSSVVYQNPLLTLRLAARLGNTRAFREFKVTRRPNF